MPPARPVCPPSPRLVAMLREFSFFDTIHSSTSCFSSSGSCLVINCRRTTFHQSDDCKDKRQDLLTISLSVLHSKSRNFSCVSLRTSRQRSDPPASSQPTRPRSLAVGHIQTAHQDLSPNAKDQTFFRLTFSITASKMRRGSFYNEQIGPRSPVAAVRASDE